MHTVSPEQDKPAGAGVIGCAASTIPVLAFVLALFAAKAWLIAGYGNQTPYWDQWDSEAALLYAPWLEGVLTWDQLVATHAEHRILMTRLLALALLEANGLWNPLLQMVANAVLHAIAIGAAILLALRGMNQSFLWTALLWALLFFMVPFAWENTLGGFQSQLYLLLLLSTGAIWLANSALPIGKRWWASVGLAGASYFCMASGSLTFFALAVITALGWARQKSRDKRYLLAIAILLTAFLGSYFAIPVIEKHQELRALDLGHFYRASLSALSWPMRPNLIFALLRNAPAIVLLILVLRAPDARHREMFIVGLLVWSLGQSLAIAFGRASDIRASRYLDLYAWAAIANMLAAICLIERAQDRHRIIARTACWVWMSVLLIGVVSLASKVGSELIAKRELGRLHETNTRAYVVTDGGSRLRGAVIPYPDPERLEVLLDRPSIRSVLPTAIAPPIAVTWESRPSGAFVVGGTSPAVKGSNELSWGSFTTRAEAETGSAHFKMQIPTRAHGIEVALAGYPRAPQMGVQAVQSDEARKVRPVQFPEGNWVFFQLRADPGPLEILLTDGNPSAWVAIGPPRPVGRLDRLTRWTLENPQVPSLLAFLIGIAVLILGRRDSLER